MVIIFLILVTPAMGARVSDLGYWGAVFELGYDPVKGRALNELACRRIEMVYEFNQLASDQLQPDRELSNTYQDIRAMLSVLDAGNLYSVLPYPHRVSRWRGIGIRGQSRLDSFRLTQYDPYAMQHIEFIFSTDRRLPDDFVHFGDFDFQTFITPVAGNAYRFVSDLLVNVEDLTAMIPPRIVSGLLSVSWQNAVGPVSDSPAKLDHNYYLSQTGLNVLRGFAAEFPNLFKAFTKYIEIDSIVSSQASPRDGSLKFNFRSRFNQPAVAANYPEIGAVLDKLSGMVYFNGRFFNDQNQMIGFVELDSADNSLLLQFRTRKGSLLPLAGAGAAETSAGINLTNQDRLQLYTEFDIHLNIVGLHLEVASLHVPVIYSLNNRIGCIKACLVQPPEKISAGGRAFGLFPLWLIDILIPSNVEQITRDFFELLATGNNGQGAKLTFAGLPHSPARNSLRIRADGDVLANGTIKLGFSLQRRFAREQQKLLDEIQMFKSEILQAFYMDYQRIKEERGCR